MKINDATLLLKSFGWKASKDEVGDRYTLFQLPDRVVQIVYGIRRFVAYQSFSSTLSVSTGEFSSASSRIEGSGRRCWPLLVRWEGLSVMAPELLPEHIQQASDEAIAWAQSQDLDKALRDHAALPTDAPGTGPVLHLASLAILGEVEKLKSYQASFEAGDRLGFVPYVTKDYIDRAVAVAEELAAKS
jgi:hypothetical protein